MEDGFIKSSTLINEDYRVDDLLDFTGTIAKFQSFLSNIKSHSLVGLVGDYGTGKSTMLYQIEKQNPDNWIVFDAWAFPNRKDLWEGFVLDFAKKMSAKEFEKAREKIDGGSKKDFKSLINIVAEGANLFIPGAGIVKNFSSLFKSSPARRVFEFKEMFKDLIDRQAADLFIVIEDADRAGQEGIIFLETIKQFVIKELADYKKYKVTFIIPIGKKNYENLEYEASYRKTLDYKFDFDPEINFEKFIEAIFIDVGQEKFTYWKENLNQLCKFFIENGRTIRDLKAILRMANHSYIVQKSIEGFSPDARVTIMIEMHDFLKAGYKMTNLSRDVRKIQMLETNGIKFYGAFVAALSQNASVGDVIENINKYNANVPEIVFRKNHELSLPKKWHDLFSEEKINWMQLSDLYLSKSKTEI